ncbi:uncharacterized protein LOC134833302 [Culicoides brevitarsis]|uniref:uncharacterized protein LOC134833302 n=1 Tax=Culicoides brevitarsis TaxID=469753 RepID=UPI00307B268D
MLLVQSIKITDKFGFEKQQGDLDVMQQGGTVFLAPDANNFCVNGLGLVASAAIFLLAQLAVIAIWTYMYQRRQRKHSHFDETILNGTVPGPQIGGSRTDSMCKLYETGYQGRVF